MLRDINLPRVLLALACLVGLAGCDKNYSGELADDGYNAAGHAHYQQMCASCHGIDGNGTSVGPSLVGCATCSSFSVLTDEISRTMPIGDVQACVEDCASDTAEYILYAFNGQNLADALATIKGVENQSAALTLRKAALQLAGRLPTPSELALVSAEGEAGLSKALDGILLEDSFHKNLMSFFNEQLLTDKYLTSNLYEGGINLLDSDDYPNRKWYNDTYAGDALSDIRSCVRTITNDSVAREPLELVRYAAMNDLPHTLYMTADYLMVNWYSQQVYEAELVESGQFRQLSEPVCDEDGVQIFYDPDDFRPARVTKQLQYELGGIPHAGVLTSAMFLNRYPTTDTNRNRHRSRMVFDYFLDTDILAIEGERPADGIGSGIRNPTLLDPACYACHQVMDPVSSAFQHWTDRGQYIVTGSTSENDWDSSDIEPPGLGGEQAQLSGSGGYFRNLLQWLGQEIAADPRFVRATVRTLYEGMIGQSVLMLPSEDASEDEKLAYNSQRAILNSIGDAMVAADWDIKDGVKAVILSPYYRASAVDTDALTVNEHIGATQFLSPEQMQAKLQAIVGFGWDEFRHEDNRIMYGGMDSDSVIERIREPGGLVIAIQNRMAAEMACRSAAYDFLNDASQRRLFPHVETETLPYDLEGIESSTAIARIRENIRYLHWVLLGEDLSEDSPELQATYDLFAAVLEEGQYMLENREQFSPEPSSWMEWDCRARWYRQADGRTDGDLPDEDMIQQDEYYSIRAWTAVLAYLMSDYRFIYE